MQAISNLSALQSILNVENPAWQRIIYDRTKTIPIPYKNREGICLFGACGYIDLDDDAVYTFRKGRDLTSYIEIGSIDALCRYILAMESYQTYLVDISLGQFSKSELFWGVWSTLITPKVNQQRTNGAYVQDWGLYHIQLYQNLIELHMPLIEYNDCSLWIDYDAKQSLSEALESVAVEMNKGTEDLEEIPVYHVVHSALQAPPCNYEDLYTKLCSGGEFSWLQ